MGGRLWLLGDDRLGHYIQRLAIDGMRSRMIDEIEVTRHAGCYLEVME